MEANSKQKTVLDRVPQPWRSLLAIFFGAFFVLYYPFTQWLPSLLFNSSSAYFILVIFAITSAAVILSIPIYLGLYLYFNWPIYTFTKHPDQKTFWRIAFHPEILKLILIGLIFALSGGYFLQKTISDLQYGPQQFTGQCAVEKEVTHGRGSHTSYYVLPLHKGQRFPDADQVRDEGIYINWEVFPWLSDNSTENTVFPCKRTVSMLFFSDLRVLWKIW